MTLKEERRMILNMVKENTISVEEGERLFDALEASEPKKTAKYLKADVLSRGGVRLATSLPSLPSLPPLPPLQPRRASHVYRRETAQEIIDKYEDLGFLNLDTEEYKELLRNNVTPNYIREIQEAGLPNVDTDELNELRNNRVSPDYIRTFKLPGNEDGDVAFEVDDIIECKRSRVSQKYVREFLEIFPDIDIDEIIEAYTSGISLSKIKA